MKLPPFKFRTLHQRLIFIVIVEISVSLILLILVSYQTIYSIEKNKLMTSMVSSLQQITDKMEQNYLDMIQISQQMSPEGVVGYQLDSYFEAENNYDKFQIKQQITENLIKISFANSNIGSRLYYNPVNNQNYFYNFATRDNFSPLKIDYLRKNGSVYYHSLHQSASMATGTWQVLSIARQIISANGTELVIYIESRMESDEFINTISKTQNMNYILLQLDNENKIAYSSSTEFFRGRLFEMDNEKQIESSYFGRHGSYVGVRQVSPDCTNVLLLPVNEYNREFYAWIRNVVTIVFLVFFLMIFSSIVISRLVYKPISIFSKEIKKMGKGDLNTIYVHTGAAEYDDLFDQFNNMKMQIQKLLSDVENVMTEKHQLEIEKIYYQINPHFLMNSLHSIHWLAKMHNQTDIENFTTELNYILAYSLGKIDRHATVRTEVKMLQAYLKLQNMRYDFNNNVEVEEGDYLDTPTARMILQPIAENAIHHGLDQSGMLTVRILHSTVRNAIIITIEDNGRGLTPEELIKIQEPFQKKIEGDRKAEGIGLRYVRSMLESFYQDRAIMSIKSEPAKGTKVTLLLPIDDSKTILTIK
ncbi:sensor histidine kinase [Ruminiclostridium cellobioparum]|jgi:two-component system sensor histidine kinase YesM|uniref:sensor histidine kinase n=2 Tax=Ruminiclostridium cellobioparum TaxID=29355 RepID=UPI00047F9FBF|nr:histidine kinase [Ruminiclostridium cellobioparum]